MKSFKLNGYRFIFSSIEERQYSKCKIYLPDKDLYILAFEANNIRVCKLSKFEFKVSNIKLGHINDYVFSSIYFEVNYINIDNSNYIACRSLFRRKFDYIISDNLEFLLNKKQTLELFK